MAAAGRRVALGFRAHTGWAAMIAIAEPARAPTIVRRARVEMIAGHDAGAPPFVYHAASKLALADAERLVRDCATEARRKAAAAIAAVVAELRASGHEVVAAGVIVGNRALDSPLQTILAAHSLIHAAEGALFRQAIVSGSEACALEVTCVRAADLWSRAAERLALPEPRVRTRLDEVGRQVGRPWTVDQKESLLAALVALGS